MRRLQAQALDLPGLYRISRTRLGDERGHLARLFCAEELAEQGWIAPVAQINVTHTRARGTVRGLHFQHPPHAEMKLVSCLRGEVWDVAVDLRAGSPTFGRWQAQHLSAENGHAMLIPPGFAHGLQTLSDDVELLYCHSMPFEPNAEGGLHPLDPALAILWPLPVAQLSARDTAHPMMTPDFQGLHL